MEVSSLYQPHALYLTPSASYISSTCLAGLDWLALYDWSSLCSHATSPLGSSLSCSSSRVPVLGIFRPAMQPTSDDTFKAAVRNGVVDKRPAEGVPFLGGAPAALLAKAAMIVDDTPFRHIYDFVGLHPTWSVLEQWRVCCEHLAIACKCGAGSLLSATGCTYKFTRVLRAGVARAKQGH
jgi:hypothetical protein